jgi:hypothetical protein
MFPAFLYGNCLVAGVKEREKDQFLILLSKAILWSSKPSNQDKRYLRIFFQAFLEKTVGFLDDPKVANLSISQTILN